MAHTAGNDATPGGRVYRVERHRPETTPLYTNTASKRSLTTAG